MGYTYDKELMSWIDNMTAWQEWARSKPPLKHFIKYLKWYFSEPKYEKFIKENNK